MPKEDIEYVKQSCILEVFPQGFIKQIWMIIKQETIV